MSLITEQDFKDVVLYKVLERLGLDKITAGDADAYGRMWSAAEFLTTPEHETYADCLCQKITEIVDVKGVQLSAEGQYLQLDCDGYCVRLLYYPKQISAPTHDILKSFFPEVLASSNIITNSARCLHALQRIDKRIALKLYNYILPCENTLVVTANSLYVFNYGNIPDYPVIHPPKDVTWHVEGATATLQYDNHVQYSLHMTGSATRVKIESGVPIIKIDNK